eukprot:Awhi_evm1s473
MSLLLYGNNVDRAHTHLRNANQSLKPWPVSKLTCYLKYNRSLSFLDLRCNTISNAEALADSLKHNIGIEYLDLSQNHITNTGMKSLFDAVCNHPRLKFLNLEDNFTIKMNTHSSLVKLLRENQTLSVLTVDGDGYLINDSTNEVAEQFRQPVCASLIQDLVLAIGKNTSLTNFFMSLPKTSVYGSKPALHDFVELKLSHCNTHYNTYLKRAYVDKLFSLGCYLQVDRNYPVISFTVESNI